MKDKKGVLSLAALSGVVITLLVLGITLYVGVRVDSGIQDTFDDSTTTQSLTNITADGLIYDNGTLYTVGNQTAVTRLRSCTLTITEVNFADNFTVVPSTNYTTSGCYWGLTPIVRNQSWNGTNLNVTGSLSWTTDTRRYNASEDTIDGKSNISENTPLLGTVVIFSVILGVVLVAFAVRGGSLSFGL
jgi:hypothetical protein